MVVTREIPTVGEEKKKKSVPDEVNGDGYDKTKNTSTGVGAGVNGYDSVYGTGSVVFPEAAQGNNAYQQWLKNQGLDIEGAYQQKVQQAQQAYAQSLAQNRAAYERQLGTYGATAESLAKSGLASSGYSDYLAGQAYAAQQAGNVQAGQTLALSQQAALESAQETAQQQYASYLSQVNEQAQDIYSTLQSTKGELSDEAKKYYEELGYSPEAITKAETLYSQYQATPEYAKAQAQGAQSALLSGQTLKDVTDSYNADVVNQAREDISKITDKAAQGVTKQSILAQLGYDTSSMSEEAQNKAYQRALAFSSNNSGREKFVTDQITVAKSMDTNDDAANYLQSIADVLVDWSDAGVSKQDIQNLTAKVLDQFSMQGMDKFLSSDYASGTIKYNYGDKKYSEHWHISGYPTPENDAETYRKLENTSENQTIAVVGDEVYIRTENDTLPWAHVKGLDKRSINVLSTIAKLQRAGANIS